MISKRAQINLVTGADVQRFVEGLNSDGSVDRYVLEDYNGRNRVSARSYLGALYASMEFKGEIFVVNETHDGVFPPIVDAFRI